MVCKGHSRTITSRTTKNRLVLFFQENWVLNQMCAGSSRVKIIVCYDLRRNVSRKADILSDNSSSADIISF